jgi:hypothetical protein
MPPISGNNFLVVLLKTFKLISELMGMRLSFENKKYKSIRGHETRLSLVLKK